MWEYNPAPPSELRHFGILGMKWGVRRTQAQLGKASSGEDDGDSDSGRKSGGKKKMSPAQEAKSMSDTDLRARLNRLQMEEQYSNMVARMEAKPQSKVKQLLNEAAVNLGRQSLNKIVGNMVDRAFNAKEKSFDPSKFDLDPAKAKPNDLKEAVKYYTMQKQYKTLRGEGQNGNDNSSEGSSAKSESASPSKHTYKSSMKNRYLYGKSGTASAKAEKANQKDRQRRDKDAVKWII